jgi:release factor glutamine methyltransferase
VRDYDPALALFGGPEGWEFPARFIHESYDRLLEDGVLILEIGATQAPILKEKSASRPWKSLLVSQDYQALDRFLILHR